MEDKRQKAIELAKKLAAFGLENSKDALNALLKKYDIDLNELEGETTKVYYFPFKSVSEVVLFGIIQKVLGENVEVMQAFNRATNRKMNEYAVDCTLAQSIEIKAMYEFYHDAFMKDLALFKAAFMSKNGLYDENSVTFIDESHPNFEAISRKQAIEAGLNDAIYRKQLN